MQKKYIAWPTGQQDIVRARIEAHRIADEIAQGVGYRKDNNNKVSACAVGCSLDRYNHAEYSAVLGVDLRVAKLVDRIHESLPFEEAVQWPGRVAAALRPGTDTTLAADRFTVWVLRQGVCGRNDNCAQVAGLYARRLAGEEPILSDWKAAYAAVYANAYANAYAANAADYAAAYAADAADYAANAAAAAYAADAADYAANAAAAAAYAADADAADYAARIQYWRDAETVVIEILSRC